MLTKKDLLLMSAARLYSLGVELEGAREKLRELVDRKVSYDSPEMLEALHSFQELDAQFQSLEKEHIALRDELTGQKTAVASKEQNEIR